MKVEIKMLMKEFCCNLVNMVFALETGLFLI